MSVANERLASRPAGQVPGPGRLPTFLVVGAQRSGTTSLYEYLAAHPDVFMATPKELHFFDRHLDRGVDWYRSRFEGARGERAVGEATPAYLYVPSAAEGMADVVPECRLVAVLRNPVDRAFSHYLLERGRGWEDRSFEDAIDAEPERLASGSIDELLHHSYVDRGRYVRQLRRIGERFARSALLVLLFEDLRDRPEDTYREVCRFLGVDEGFRPPVLGRVYNAADASRRRRDAGRMARAVRRRLLEAFRADNDALGEWLGRDLSSWNR